MLQNQIARVMQQMQKLIFALLTCTVATSSDRFFVGRCRCHPLVGFEVQVHDFRAVDLFLWMIWRVDIAASTENVHAVVDHRSCVEVSIRWRGAEAGLGEKFVKILTEKWEEPQTHVWIKLHCIVSRSKQCTSHENWSITSSNPPKMYILLPTMHALCPSRAPGKFPLTSGVSHSRVRVSKQNRISHTWRGSGKF